MTGSVPILDPPTAYALWAPEYPSHAHNPLMQAEERAMLSLLPRDFVGCKVLDAGCGTGRYLKHARRRGARRLIGVDLSPEMLSRAQREDAAGPAGILVCSGVDALPLPDGWADVVLCGLTLGHLPSLEPALAELSRVTRPGGRILCSDLHPIGEARGWTRTFRADRELYAVRHTFHPIHRWRAVGRIYRLNLKAILEPFLDPAEVPPNARFDPAALQLPAAIVLAFERQPQ